MISPHGTQDIPPRYWTPPRYSRYPPTVLMISPTVLNSPHGTEHPPRYCTHIIQGVNCWQQCTDILSSELYIFNFNLSNLMLPSVAFHIYLFRLPLEMKSLKWNKCMSKSLLTVFSAWVIVHGKKYSYSLKLAQIYENVSSKFCKFVASFLTQKNARYSDL